MVFDQVKRGTIFRIFGMPLLSFIDLQAGFSDAMRRATALARAIIVNMGGRPRADGSSEASAM